MNTYNTKNSKEGGWSIIETMMVSSLFCIVLSIIIVVTNPVSHLPQSRNALRFSHVNMLANGIALALTDHGETFSSTTRGRALEICSPVYTQDQCGAYGLVFLGSIVPQYLSNIPVDPSVKAGAGAGYSLLFSEDGRITVSSLYAEKGDTIIATR